MAVKDKDGKFLPFETVFLEDFHNNPNMEIDSMIVYHRRVDFPNIGDILIDYIKTIFYNQNPTIIKFNYNQNSVNVYPAVQ